MESYKEISTFCHDDYKTHIREVILNPLILQHNQVVKEVLSVKDRLVTLEGGDNPEHNFASIVANIKALETALEATNNSITSLTALSDALGDKVSQHDVELDNLVEVTEMVKLHAESIIELQTVVNNIDDELFASTSEISKLANKVHSSEHVLRFHDSRLSTLESGIKDGSFDLSHVVDHIEDLAQQTTSNTIEVSSLKKLTTEAGQEFKVLKDKVSDYTKEVNHLKGEVLIHSSDIARLDNRDSIFEESLSDLSGSISSITADHDQLMASFSTISFEIQRLGELSDICSKELDTLSRDFSTRIVNLEKDLLLIGPSVNDAVATVSGMEEKVADAEAIAFRAVEEVGVVKDYVDVVKNQALSNKTDIVGLTTSLLHVENEVKDLKELVGDTPGASPLLEQRVSVLEREMDASEVTVVGLDGRVGLTETGIADLGVRVTALEDAPPAGGGEGGTCDCDLAPIEANIAALDVRVTALEDAPPGEGGGTCDCDLAPIEANIATLTTSVEGLDGRADAVDRQIAGLFAEDTSIKEDLSSHNDRITTLEKGSGGGEVVPPPAETTIPEKWYILPIAGQSNSAGYGYFNIRETMYNPRLSQFKGANPRIEGSASPHLTGFGDMHDMMRKEFLPGVIPAANCLDHPNSGVNLFQLAMDKGGVDGGASGIGYWLAKRLLNYIPSDYGIMILPCARGSTGFIRRGEQWKVGNVLANKLKSDIVNSLKMNPENKLLPVVWVQGEDDELDGEAGPGKHNPQLAQDRFLELFNDIKNTLVRENLQDRIPSVASYTEGKPLHLGLKPIDYFRWICLSASSYIMFQNKWWEKHDRNYATSKDITHGMHLWGVPSINVWAVYDNYVYLMNTVKNTHDDSYILYSRVDTLPDGKFSLTDFDEMFDRDDGMREAHFGGTTYTQFMPAVVENVMLGYSKVLHGPMPSLYKYTLRGDVPATTDGVQVHFPTKAAGFDLPSISKPVSGNHCPIGSKDSFTISLAFKPSTARRNELVDILKFDGNGDPLLSQYKGTFVGHRFDDVCCKIPMNASITGAWNGGFDSWQHVTFTYNSNFRILNAYLNGKLVGTDSNHDGFLGKTGVRCTNPGELGTFRVLTRDISPDEAYALYLKDRR